MVPGRTIVARPSRSIALSAGIGRPGHDEWPNAGAKRQHPLERGARIFHAVDIVDFRMRCSSVREIIAFDAVKVAVRHCMPGRVEYCRLVHVIPEARKTVGHEIFVKRTPPRPGRCAGEVGKDRRARPDRSNVDFSVRGMDKVISSGAAVVRRIILSRQICHVEVGDRDQLDPRLAHVAERARACREKWTC